MTLLNKIGLLDFRDSGAAAIDPMFVLLIHFEEVLTNMSEIKLYIDNLSTKMMKYSKRLFKMFQIARNSKQISVHIFGTNAFLHNMFFLLSLILLNPQ